VDPWIIVSLGLSVATAVLVAAVVRRDRTLADIRQHVRRLRAREDERDRRAATSIADTAALHDAIGMGILRLDDGLRIAEASPTAHALLDRAPGTLPGRSLMEAFLDREVEETARGALERGSAQGDVRPTDPDVPALQVRVRRIPSGGAWLVLEDVTELQRLRRIRTEFIDNLSHELRTPLTTVSLLSETLGREAEGLGDALPSRMRDRIAKIEVETGHLVQMVNELLDLSRIESGGTLTMADGVDLGRLASESAERLRLFAERQGVTLRIEVDRPIPGVRGDAERLGQVVVNLVHNAVKFSPDGGDVMVRVQAAGDEVVTSVEDRGIGIPKASLPRVFERFYKVDRARLRPEVGGGTGLGLSIARHVVEGHGGRIWVGSDEGVGSVFSFALPVAGRSSSRSPD
jgi:two-component system phosphate regulon sensor histidine kinase PhoR